MNAYERRREERLQKARDRGVSRQKLIHMNLALRRESLLQRYEEAYKTYYGRACKATYSKGWFTVHNRRVREQRFEEMTKRLEALLHERELNAPEEL